MLTPFRDYYLIEAVDLDRTWQNYGEAVKKRAATPSSWAILVKHGGDSFHTVGTLTDHEYKRNNITPDHVNDLGHHTITSAGGLKKIRDEMGPIFNRYTPNLHDQTTKSKMWVAIPHHDNHIIATTLRSQQKEPGAMGISPKDHDDIKRDAFMGHVASSVPHPKYIPTVTRMYAEGGIKRVEDIDTQASEAFGKYHQLATNGRLNPKKHVVDTATGSVAIRSVAEMGGQEEWDKNLKTAKLLNPQARNPISETNFKAFKSLDDVRAVVNHPDHKEFFQKESKAALKGSYTTVHDDDDVTVYHPHTHEASVALAHCPHTGQKAAWCTAANSESGKDYFDSYSKDGALLIYHPKKPKYEGEMYQTHPSQQMDEQDNEVHTGREGIVFDNSTNSAVHFGTSSKHWQARFPGFNDAAEKKYRYNHVIDHPEKHDDLTFENDGDFHQYLHSMAKATKPLGEDHPERQRWRKAHSRYFPDEAEGM